MDGTAQFFKGVATVCTKLFNAVEVGPIHRTGEGRESFVRNLNRFFTARPRVLWPERYTASSLIKDSYVLTKSKSTQQ